MNNLLKNNEEIKIISLGATCAVKLFLNKYGRKYNNQGMYHCKTNFFDWIGTMAGMLPDIIKSTPIILDDEYYPENDELAKIYSWSNNTRVHKKYLLSFPHYKSEDYTNQELTMLLNRRLLNFYQDILHNKNNFHIFIYFEDNEIRHFNPKYNEKIIEKCVCKCNDINNYVVEQTIFQVKIIKKLANFFSEQFPCKFIIIYLSNNFTEDFEYSNNVLNIKTISDYDNSMWEVWADIINNTLNKYEKEITDIIQKIQPTNQRTNKLIQTYNEPPPFIKSSFWFNRY